MTAPDHTVTLANGVRMPRLGLGTWPMDDAEAAVAVRRAIEGGYRLIDTAENYGNEAGVGAAIAASGVDRAELFVTTKFNRRWHSVDGVRQACEASLRRLGLDYVDLLLIHWPNPDQGTYVEAFEGLLAVQDAGLVRCVGTSNFLPEHLDRLFARGYSPQVNQIQLDPYHPRDAEVAVHAAHGIVTESWSPLGRGGELLADSAITALATKHDRTPAQVVLAWHLAKGYVPLPKSSDAARQASNLASLDLVLDEAEMASLDLGRPDPDMADPNKFGH